jgi:hypothetical protein
MSFRTETLGARLTRLLEANLRDPAQTRSILERLTSEQKAQPQLRNHDAELRQSRLFEE